MTSQLNCWMKLYTFLPALKDDVKPCSPMAPSRVGDGSRSLPIGVEFCDVAAVGSPLALPTRANIDVTFQTPALETSTSKLDHIMHRSLSQ